MLKTINYILINLKNSLINKKISNYKYRRKLYITILSIICICIIPYNVQATEETISSESIMKSQQEALNINSFIQEADKYTQDVYEDLDMGELFTSAISGNIDNETIINSIIRAVRRRSF